MGGRVFRNYYKGHMDKTKREGGSRGRRWVWLVLGGLVRGKCRQLQLNNNKVIFFKKALKVNVKTYNKD